MNVDSRESSTDSVRWHPVPKKFRGINSLHGSPFPYSDQTRANPSRCSQGSAPPIPDRRQPNPEQMIEGGRDPLSFQPVKDGRNHDKRQGIIASLGPEKTELGIEIQS
jgi:hypothetical protein